MAQCYDIDRPARSFDARQRLKLFVFQCLFNCAQTIRSLRMPGRRQVVQTGWMTEDESRHRLDLSARRPSWKCLRRYCIQTDALWRWTFVRHEEIHLQWLGGVDAVLIKVADTFTGQECIVDQEIPGKGFRFQENATSGFGENFRFARSAHHSITTEQVLDRCGGDGGTGP